MDKEIDAMNKRGRKDIRLDASADIAGIRIFSGFYCRLKIFV
jgi:hypothetical protein